MLFFTIEQYSVVWCDNLLVEVYFSPFQFGAIANKAMNICVQVFMWNTKLHFSKVNAQECHMDHTVVSHLVFLFFFFNKMPDWIQEWLYYFTHPTAMQERPNLSTSLPVFDIISISYFSHANRYEVASHSGFNSYLTID